jgi:hypothetical protein
MRVDVRSVLTVAEAGRDGVREVLAEYPGIGLAPLPAPRRRVFRRAAGRLGANGLLAVGALPGRGALRGAARAGAELAAVNADPPPVRSGLKWGPVLVDRHSRAERWRRRGVEPSAVADVELLLVPAGVDPDFKGLVAPGPERQLYWCDRLPSEPGQARAFVEAWGAEPKRLVVSGPAGPAVSRLKGVSVQRLSEWDRGYPEPGTVLWADDQQWLPAVAASANAAFLAEDAPGHLWSALAQGVPLTLGRSAVTGLADRGVDAEAAGDAVSDAEQAAAQWVAWQETPFALRDRQARTRRAFWQARRDAEKALSALDDWVDAW